MRKFVFSSRLIGDLLLNSWMGFQNCSLAPTNVEVAITSDFEFAFREAAGFETIKQVLGIAKPVHGGILPTCIGEDGIDVGLIDQGVGAALPFRSKFERIDWLVTEKSRSIWLNGNGHGKSPKENSGRNPINQFS
jgi:hypothetical protein